MKRTIFLFACFFGVTSVGLGAFGAHGLQGVVDDAAIRTFETGVRYQMYHAFFLFIVGLLPSDYVPSKKGIFLCTLLGMILFSFSIYALALNSLTDFDFKIIGICTPIGGVLLIAAWGMLAYQIWKSKLD